MEQLAKIQSLIQQHKSGEQIDFVALSLCMYEMSVNHIYDPCLIIALNILITNLNNIDKSNYLMIEDALNKVINIENDISDMHFNDGKEYSITNSYYNESCSGVGDFLRGCCFLKRIFKNTNVNVQIDFENHYLGKYIKSQSSTLRQEIFDTEKHNKDLCSPVVYFANMVLNLKHSIKMLKDKQHINVFSNFSDYVSLDANSRPSYKLEDEEISFMRDNIIFQDEVINYVKRLNLNKFTLIHFRLGDREMLNMDNLDENNQNTKSYNISYQDCLRNIQNIADKTDNKIVVISDSNKFKESLQGQKIICPHLKSDHCSHNPGYVTDCNIDHEKKKDAMFYVAVDMYLSSIASDIYSYSVYPWGSGFVFWLSKIFNVPIFTKIMKEQ